MLRNDLALGRRVWLVFGLLGLCAMALPARAQLCAPFDDVLAASGFCGNIQWLYNRGVTEGCTAPPGQTWYCPTQFVRRDQMAAFMNRLADELFPLNCGAGQVMKWNGLVWACANDAIGGSGAAWALAGNAGTNPASQFLGTTDNQALVVRVNNLRALRIEPNPVSPNLIGGNPSNAVSAGVRGATIGGGGTTPGNTDPTFDLEGPNIVTDAYGTVGGGYDNRAGDNAGTVVDAPFATVGGGAFNEASGSYATVAGGSINTASGDISTIGGGRNNTASGILSTIGGGLSNWARGVRATVPGGSFNEANGDFSVAMGRGAVVNGDGSFLFADASSTSPLMTVVPNRFVVGASGGIVMGSLRDLSTGCTLLSGSGTWLCTSDRHVKQDFAAVDVNAILQKVVALPITTWRFKDQPGAVRHIGPMAQDFRSVFGLGVDDKTIAQVDVTGVALAAIQGLNAKLEAERAAKDAEIAALRAELAELREVRAELAAIRSVLASIHGTRVTQIAEIAP